MNIKKLDPYYYLDLFIEFLHRKGINIPLFDFFLDILFSLFLAYLILIVLGLLLGVKDPMMIVVSGSMIPNLNIGDIVVLKKPINLDGIVINYDGNLKDKALTDFAKINYDLNVVNINNQEYLVKTFKSLEINGKKYYNMHNGDIIVYHSNLLNRDIIHRIVFIIKAKDGNYYVTKGDNDKTNFLLDQDCTFGKCISLKPIPENKVKAKYWFKIPYVGYIKIWIVNLFV